MINFLRIGRGAKEGIWKMDLNELEDIHCYGPVFVNKKLLSRKYNDDKKKLHENFVMLRCKLELQFFYFPIFNVCMFY
jgi:hypothetical protein